MHQLFQEPHINLGLIVNGLCFRAAQQCLINRKDALIVLGADFVHDCRIGKLVHGRHVQTVHRNLRTADRLHQCLFKGLTDRHDLTGGFHLCAKLSLSIDKFIKRPFRELYNNIVKRRFKACHGLAGYFILNFV